MRKYLELGSKNASPTIRIPALGIREEMPKGLIRHGGRGTRFPFLLMLFHGPAYVYEASGRRMDACDRAVLWDYESEHRYGSPFGDWNHSWLHFEGTAAREAVEPGSPVGLIPFGVPVELRERHFIERYLELLYDELQRPPPRREDVLGGLLRLILMEMPQGPLASASSRSRSTADGLLRGLEAARRLLEERYTEPFDLAAAAAAAGLSRAHFSYRFAERYNVPPREYVIRLRLHRAELLLCNPDITIAQAAALVGYGDPLYFSRLFRKRYGRSPRDFRSLPPPIRPR